MFPERASTFAGEVDLIYVAFIGLSLMFAIPIVLALIYLGTKYRQGSNADRSRPVSHSMKLEMTWIAIPLVLAMGAFTWGTTVYFRMVRPPSNTLEISALGKQWMWKFQHPDGQSEINELHVPVGRPVKLTMISQDVLHSFYVPAFRVKQDVIPGYYTQVWFEPSRTGEYHLFCAEYCGTQHAGMIGQVIVMEPADYEAWLGGRRTAAPPAAGAGTTEAGGEQIFQQLGCSGCHVTGGGGPGPALEGIFGQPVRLENGEAVIADENYIRESIVNPNAQIVEGYDPIMPSYQGQVSEEQLMQLVDYIESLGANEGAGEPGATAEPEETAESTTEEAAEPAATATPE